MTVSRRFVGLKQQAFIVSDSEVKTTSKLSVGSGRLIRVPGPLWGFKHDSPAFLMLRLGERSWFTPTIPVHVRLKQKSCHKFQRHKKKNKRIKSEEIAGWVLVAKYDTGVQTWSPDVQRRVLNPESHPLTSTYNMWEDMKACMHHK